MSTGPDTLKTSADVDLISFQAAHGFEVLKAIGNTRTGTLETWPTAFWIAERLGCACTITYGSVPIACVGVIHHEGVGMAWFLLKVEAPISLLIEPIKTFLRVTVESNCLTTLTTALPEECAIYRALLEAIGFVYQKDLPSGPEGAKRTSMQFS